MKSWFYIRALACAALFLAASVSRSEVPVTVFAAASLKTALDEISLDWPAPVTISYAGSGIVARQVAQSAPADVVILANTRWMEWLHSNGAVDPASTRVLLGNSLVVIGSPEKQAFAADSPGAIIRALGDGRLAIGQTETVPAGIYGRAWLENIGAWSDLAPRLAETENVRAALAFVARRETPLGLVYASDAKAEPRVKTLYQVPPDLHPDIVYPAAYQNATGADFLSFLSTPKAMRIFEENGFLPMESEP